jgi:Cu2+-exporting ATPase
MKESTEATTDFKERFISSIKAGFLIEIPPQSYIPVDGIIESGLSAIDNSFLTGESSPLKVSSGSKVLAGAKNIEASLIIKALCDNGKSRIHRILNNVFEAGSKRLKIQTTLDRLSKYFVLTVLSIAIITFIYWYLHSGLPEALRVSVAILIITCPCALGMAAPLINTRAVQQAAQFGIYLNSAEVFERLAQIEHFYFDKTGTLTQGDFVVLKIYYTSEIEPEFLLYKICAIENHTSHPIGRAFNKLQLEFQTTTDAYANIILTGFKEFAGFGVEGIFNNQERISIGSKAFMDKQGVKFTVDDSREAGILLELQETLVFVAINFKLVAIFVLGDQLRSGGRELVDLLESQQKKVYLLTGDLKTSALAKARELGLSEDCVYAEMEPEAKASLIKSDNLTTCMIGDGINDVAALKNSSLGIAVSGGSEASLMFADCFIKDFDLDKFILLFSNSHRVILAIKKNVLISLAYNLVGVALAAAGYINPLVAAVFMPISSLSVIVFSLFFKFTNK